MQEIIVTNKDKGQRLDKFLKRYFPGMNTSLMYKMLRKKNITLNKKKAIGDEIINSNDVINTFFSDETFSKFTNGSSSLKQANSSMLDSDSNNKVFLDAYNKLKNISIVYEDDDLIFINKPVGVLAQTDQNNKISVNEWLVGYLISTKSEVDINRFKPSSCNRLDRNTSGLVMCAKTYIGARFLTEMIRNHQMNKYYLALAEGKVSKELELKGYLKKNNSANKVKIYKDNVDDSEFINTKIFILNNTSDNKSSLLKIKLITGKTHQIRAHLSSIGHPLCGDLKYGGHTYKGMSYQMLHSYEIVFPDNIEDDYFKYLESKKFQALPPDYFGMNT